MIPLGTELITNYILRRNWVGFYTELERKK